MALELAAPPEVRGSGSRLDHREPPILRTVLLTALAMLAFAANSILCRLALGSGEADAATFTSIRLLSGAGVLILLAGAGRSLERPRLNRHGLSAAMLFLYAVAFSYAYLKLSAGTGALILFGAVQVTMLAAGLTSGERPGINVWIGLVSAVLGLFYLVSPGLAAPSPVGALLMAMAGGAWGAYSLLGRKSPSALHSTAHNFVLAVPLAVAVSLATHSGFHLTATGAVLAFCSGALTSGLGYVVWYAALRGLSATGAALVQLTVPVIAACAGVLLLAESWSGRLTVASLLILGGVALAMNFARRR